MDSFEKFREEQLPSKDAFFSSLTNEGISEEDYTHAQNVFESFEMVDLRDFHNLYLITDVLLLADVFESFRDTCMQHYGLDPAHNYTAPGLAWQAALKMTGVEMDLLTDMDMHLFIEEGIRGGVSMISHRYAKANVPELDDYDPTKPNEYLMYLDANNLYGWAMSQALPTSDFKWEENVDNFDVSAVPADNHRGYILEVDLGKTIIQFKRT